MAEHSLGTADVDSVILLKDGKAYVRSTAALHIARKMNGLWPMFFVFIVVPKPLRDWAYDAIAKRRYKWFGKKESCRLPTPEEQTLFLG